MRFVTRNGTSTHLCVSWNQRLRVNQHLELIIHKVCSTTNIPMALLSTPAGQTAILKIMMLFWDSTPACGNKTRPA